MNFAERFTEEGEWRVGVEGPPCRGVFSYDPVVGLRLDIESEEDILEKHVSMNTGPVSITGLIGGGFRTVTLTGCYLTNTSSSGTITRATYVVSRALRGRRTSPCPQPTVHKLIVGYTLLTEWINPAHFVLTVQPTTPTTVLVQLQPLNVDAVTNEDGRTELRLVTHSRVDRKAAHIEAIADFVITPTTPITLDEAIEKFVRPIENFLTFGTGKINAVNRLTVHTGDKTNESAPEVASVLYKTVQAHSTTLEWLSTPHGRGLFSLLDVQTDFSERLTKWLRLCLERKSLIDLLFSVIYGATTYPEPRFLAMVQAVEGYHRQSSGLSQHRMAKTEYTALRKTALAALPNSMRELFGQILAAGNEVSLRARLDDLNDRFGPVIPGVLTAEDRATFGKDCARARNAIAHHLDDPEFLDPHRLITFTEYLLRLLLVGFMTEVGFTAEEARLRLQHGMSLTQARHRI